MSYQSAILCSHTIDRCFFSLFWSLFRFFSQFNKINMFLTLMGYTLYSCGQYDNFSDANLPNEGETHRDC